MSCPRAVSGVVTAVSAVVGCHPQEGASCLESLSPEAVSSSCRVAWMALSCPRRPAEEPAGAPSCPRRPAEEPAVAPSCPRRPAEEPAVAPPCPHRCPTKGSREALSCPQPLIRMLYWRRIAAFHVAQLAHALCAAVHAEHGDAALVARLEAAQTDHACHFHHPCP